MLSKYENIFKDSLIYSNIALELIAVYPHSDIISNARIDKLQNFFQVIKQINLQALYCLTYFFTLYPTIKKYNIKANKKNSK